MKIKPASKNYFAFSFDRHEYNEPARQLLEALKQEIPTVARKYYPDKREWRFHNDHYLTFEKLFIEYLRSTIQNQFELF